MMKIAAIKFAGLCAGGTEKWLQTIICNLPKDRFQVDYYYCDAAPYIGSSWVHPQTDEYRKQYMEQNRIPLKKFKVGAKNVNTPTHDWVDTDFWEIFDENKYDLILSARAGHKEYPFHLTHKPEVALITLAGMVENNPNTKKYIHISEFQIEKWLQAGGDRTKAEVVYLFTEHMPGEGDDYRKQFGIEDKIVIGLHQRAENTIFSPVPLSAYSKVKNTNTVFVIMGGGDNYQKQAKELKLDDVIFLPHSADEIELNKFLRTLNVYAHGRADGETYGQCIAEAMSYGIPIVSHTAASNGHIETIGDGGEVFDNMDGYVSYLNSLVEDRHHRKMIGEKAKNRFDNSLSIDNNMPKIITILEKAVEVKQIEGNIL